MAAAEHIDPLKPGDPPPFWDGPWHPQGLSEGAVIVRPRMSGNNTVIAGPTGAAVPLEASRTVPAPAPAAVQGPPGALEPHAPATAEAAPPRHDAQAAEPPPQTPMAAAPPPDAPPVAPPAPVPDAPSAAATPPTPAPAPAPDAPPAAATAPAPPAQEPAAPSGGAPHKPPASQPRSLVLTLLAQGPAQTAPTLPVAVDVMRADALRAKARELQAQGQLGHALAALAEALKANAGDAASYAQIGHVLMAARAPEDAAHHFLLAYMLAPKEPQIGRLTIHASWALGYVGWAFQVAQAVYKLQPTQEWVEMGRAAMAWLKSSRPAGHTLLCTACRTMAIRPEHGPCPRCGGATMGAPANDAGFIGLRLMQQSPPTGRLFVGAACAGCYAETVVLVKPGGTRCPYCQEALLAPVPA